MNPEITPWIEPVPTPPPRRGRFRCSLPVLLVCVNIAGMIVFGHHQLRKSRVKANVRACLANQKTIAGALEMYALDNKVDFTPEHGKPVSPETFETLRQNGYLRSVPTDPGMGIQSSYSTDPDGTIRCGVHGTVESPIVPDVPWH
jgi:hypothetical protein